MTGTEARSGRVQRAGSPAARACRAFRFPQPRAAGDEPDGTRR